MRLLFQFFTWWHGQTLGTRLHTWRRGEFVGADEQGNRYYQDKTGNGRRWVIYNGLVEASRVPPAWHGWLHHGVDEPPQAQPRPPWHRAHRPNMTGTGAAYRPPGALERGGIRAAASGDYTPWTPEATADAEPQEDSRS